jgi:hypothetical protein
MLVMVLLAAGAAGAAAPDPLTEVQEPELARPVREAVLDLPYYGVFDLITFQIDDPGVVTLGGYVYEASLQRAVESAVKKVEGVKEVRNRIEQLPVSITDDELRWGVYWAIYRDSPLFRYGSAAALGGPWRPAFRPWGRRFRSWDTFRRPLWIGAPFWGMEPLGNHAIHILVRHSEVTLVGVVDTQADKDLANLKARSVFGVMSVNNDLEVAPPSD